MLDRNDINQNHNFSFHWLCNFTISVQLLQTITGICLSRAALLTPPCPWSKMLVVLKRAGNAGTSNGQLLFPMERHLHGSMAVVMPHLITTFASLGSILLEVLDTVYRLAQLYLTDYEITIVLTRLKYSIIWHLLIMSEHYFMLHIYQNHSHI